MAWLLWIALALVCLGGEAVTGALVLASFGVAALLTSPISLVAPLPAQIVAFAILSLLLLLIVRPLAMRALPGGSSDAGPPHPLTGRQAVAIGPIDRGGGQIRVGTSEFWTARPAEGRLIPAGAMVEVLAVEGLTAVVRAASDPAPAPKPAAQSPDRFALSGREREVLTLMADGLTNGEIAERLIVSTRTVDHHVSHILDKMGVSSRVEAVRVAIECGLVGRNG